MNSTRSEWFKPPLCSYLHPKILMHHLLRSVALILLLHLFFSCNKDQRPAMLEGQWTTYRYERVDSSVLEEYLDQITLEIDELNRYRFTSTLNYEEAGTYRLSERFFLVTDTTRAPIKEKKLFIRYLSADTLILAMEEDGEDRTLMMTKTPIVSQPESQE